jgi:hypothetical protein
MKVLIIGGFTTPSRRGQLMIDLLLRQGHEIVYETPKEVQERRSRAIDFRSVVVYDECREYQREVIKQAIANIRENQVIKIKNNPGPRDRWGKVK